MTTKAHQLARRAASHAWLSSSVAGDSQPTDATQNWPKLGLAEAIELLRSAGVAEPSQAPIAKPTRRRRR